MTLLPSSATSDSITGFPVSTAGYDDSLTIGRKFAGGTGNRALNLPSGNNGTTQRSGFQLSWNNGLILTNLAGNDLVVYESGSNATTPEAFMVQVHDRINDVWSIWVYQPASNVGATAVVPEVLFATAFDLSAFGIAANGEVDAIRVVNMTNEDRMLNVSGTGQVIPEDNGATSTTVPLPGGLASFGAYGASTLDPDPLYVGILHPLTPGSSAFDANSALGATVNVNPDGSYTYDPRSVLSLRQLPGGATMDDTFSYTAQDDDGFDTTTVTITVTGVNEAPVGVNDAYAANEDTVLAVPTATGVLANDTDVDAGAVLSVTAFDAVSARGAVVFVVSDGSFFYDPSAVPAIQGLAVGQTLVDTFTYTVSDGDGGSDTAITVTITVSGRNDPPVAVDDAFATTSTTVLNVPAPGVLANDTDPDTGTVLRVAGPGQQLYTFATVTFDQAGTPTILTPLAPGTYDGAVINSEPDDTTTARGGFPDDATNFKGEYSLGRLFESSTGTTVSGVNLPLGDVGTVTRSGVQLSWENGLSLTNLVGNDFVIYESGGANEPEGYMVQVRGTDSGIWSNWVYVPASQVAAYGVPGEFLFATIFNLDDFGISANDRIDAFRIANLIAADRIQAGTNIVLPGDNDATSTTLPAAGPLASFPNYGAASLDPDPVYLGVLHQLVPTSPAFDATSALGATVVVNADGSFSYDPTTSATLTTLAFGVTMDDTFDYTVTDGFGGFSTATVTVTVSGVNAPPTATITFPPNGATFIAPASFTMTATATDVDGTITQVEFRETISNTSLGTDTTSPYSVDLSNLASGTYTFVAIATDDDGVTGTSAPITITVLANPPLGAVSSVSASGAFFIQSGLMSQTVVVSNPSPIPIQAVRLTLQGLAPGIVLYNATGTNGLSEPYVQHNFPVPAGGSVTFFIEYYVANRITIPAPTFLAELMPVDAPVVPVGTVQSLLRTPPVVIPGGHLLLDFATVAGRTYHIQYSADMATWITVVPSQTGTGSTRQWIDNGPPKTQSHPSTVGARFYRIIEVP
ncbi:MAG: Ig-like domain-containing protein [Verrucomicrobiota bacterium]